MRSTWHVLLRNRRATKHDYWHRSIEDSSRQEAFEDGYFDMAGIQAYAQVPKGINYQGVARLATGTPIADKTISIRISVLQNSANGTSEYAETH